MGNLHASFSSIQFIFISPQTSQYIGQLVILIVYLHTGLMSKLRLFEQI
jgi:hypothetical protein